MLRKIVISTLFCASAIVVGAVPQTFAENAEEEVPQIESVTFQRGLLSILQLSRRSMGQFGDVTDVKLTYSMAPFCRMPSQMKRRFKAFETIDFLPPTGKSMAEAYAALNKEVISLCNMRIFSAGEFYTIVYNGPPVGGPRSDIEYTDAYGAHLRIVMLPNRESADTLPAAAVTYLLTH